MTLIREIRVLTATYHLIKKKHTYKVYRAEDKEGKVGGTKLCFSPLPLFVGQTFWKSWIWSALKPNYLYWCFIYLYFILFILFFCIWKLARTFRSPLSKLGPHFLISFQSLPQLSSPLLKLVPPFSGPFLRLYQVFLAMDENWINNFSIGWDWLYM